jgi:DNA-binding NtrC family response regulator
MPPEVQVKLLRVLQEGSFERLGGTRTLHVDVRVVAATNKNLLQEVEAQRFREDLYYRLNVISLHLPPLCERQDDIPLLAAHFLRKYAQQNNKEITGIQQQALQLLQTYPWPGNVRELENVIERAVVLAQDSIITVEALGLETHQIRRPPISPDQFVLPPKATMAQVERAAIIQALEQSDGNRRAAARLLDIGAATLYRKVKQYNIE